jgi:hypothetical protein
MHMVNGARSAWRWFSIQLAVVGGAVQTAAIAWPDFKTWLGDVGTHIAGAVMFFGIIAGRLVKQKDRDAS